MTKILIVEDEEKIARFVELELKHEGYEVAKAGDGRSGLEMAESGDYDIILLDILLPELNGFELLRRLRKSSDVPVIMLTAKDEVMDKVAGLDMGADDYITKPFFIEELLARIRTILRKQGAQSPQSQENVLTYDKLSMDLARHQVTYDGHSLDLSAREFDLLHYFMDHAELVVTREQVLEAVWSYDYLGESNVVDVYVRYLRQKIDEVFGVKLLQTVRGVGYTLRRED